MTSRFGSKGTRNRVRAIALIGVAGVVASGCGSDASVAARPDANREIVINMDEFSYDVDLIELHPGETVTFVLVNLGDNEHELMIGRNVQDTPEGFPNGFEHDFFETITPKVDPPSAGMDMGAMDMGGDGHGDMEGMDMSGDGSSDMPDHDGMDMPDEGASDMPDHDGMDMPDEGASDMPDHDGMDMGDEGSSDMPDHDGMDMSDDGSGDMADDGHGAEEPDAEGDGHGDEGMDMGGDDHSGFMIQRRAGESARITITVPDDVLGEWEIGCFRGRGSHWDAGMRARLIVTEA